MKRDVKKHQRANGAIRIISGRWRGRKLPVLDVSGLRPTTDKNKETLFNWLMPYTQGSRCLDAFAGSGSLGFEALSRDARYATFIELDKKVAANLQQNLALLKVETAQARVISGDTLAVLGQLAESYDLIFLDPPFNHDLLPQCIELIAEYGLLQRDGIIYIECETQNAHYPVPANWQLLKQQQGKQVVARLYQNIG
ncbi:MAG: 16S rRNA (guanine966-N2)-methyltransferase [Paraglaciecola sp.]|jgi:16S rRNA (guanine966-N2)-methyltransferase